MEYFHGNVEDILTENVGQYVLLKIVLPLLNNLSNKAEGCTRKHLHLKMLIRGVFSRKKMIH